MEFNLVPVYYVFDMKNISVSLTKESKATQSIIKYRLSRLDLDIASSV